MTVETTELDEREGPLLQPSLAEKVSDGACREANHTTRQITRTLAQTILESQETEM